MSDEERTDMIDDVLFPEEALKYLRATIFVPNATRGFEMMSGGFWWSDEFPKAALDACFDQLNWAWRRVIAYRTSLIVGQPRDEFKAVWEQLERECPNWPGHRTERRSPELLPDLALRMREYRKPLPPT